MNLLRKYDRRIWIIFCARMIAAFGFSVAMPYISLYFHIELGVPMKIVGTILMISAATGALAQIWGGEISDHLGRRSLMIYSMLVRGIAFLLVAFFVYIKSHFLVVAFFLILNSIIGSLFMPASNAMIADVSDQKIRIEAYGLIRIGANAGWAIGPAIGGFLATLSYASLFIITSITCFASALIIHFFTNESLARDHREEPGLRDIFSIIKDHSFMKLCLFATLIHIVMGQLVSPLSVYVVERVGISKIEMGYLFSLNGLLVVALQYPMTKLLKQRLLVRFLVIGSLVYGLGYFTVGIDRSLLTLMLSIVIVTFGEMIVSPSSTALASYLAPENRKGRYLGFFGLTEHLGWSLGPFVGGILLDLFPGRSLFIWAVIALISIISASGFANLKSSIK